MPSDIVTASEFALFLKGVQHFFSSEPPPSSHTITVVASPDKSSHNEIPVALQQEHQQSTAQLHRQFTGSYAPNSKDCPSAATAKDKEGRSGSASDQQAPEPWVASNGLNRNHATAFSSQCTNDSYRAVGVESVQISAPVLATPFIAPSASTTKKDCREPALATNFASATPFTKDRSNRSPTLIPLPEPQSTKGAATITPSVKHGPDNTPHLLPSTHDVLVEHGKYQSKIYSTEPKEEFLDGYSKHPTHCRSDPYYTQTDMMQSSDDGYSTQAILQGLRPLLDEPRSTDLTEEEKRVLIEHGRAIGKCRDWTHQRHQRGSHYNNHNSNHRLQQHQHHYRRNNHPNDSSLQGQSASVLNRRHRVTYSREFLVSFSGFNAPPDSIDRIRWIQQSPTLDQSKNVAQSRTLKSQHRVIQEPTMQQQSLQELSDDHIYQEMHESKLQRYHISRKGASGGEVSTSSFPMPAHQQNLMLNRLQEAAGPRVPRVLQLNIQEPSRNLQGSHGPDLRRCRSIGERREETAETTMPSCPTPRPPSPTVPRSNVQRSYVSASGSLSGGVYRFKIRDPLRPPATPRAGFEMRGFQPRTTV